MGTIVDSVAGTPMCSVAQEVERVGGIEEEFFFEGTATQFVLAGAPSEYPTDGRWNVVPAHEQPFRTRMLVVRPRYPADFNGSSARRMEQRVRRRALSQRSRRPRN